MKRERKAFNFKDFFITLTNNTQIDENQEDFQEELNAIKKEENTKIIEDFEKRIAYTGNKKSGRKSDKMNVKVKAKNNVSRQVEDKSKETEKERE